MNVEIGRQNINTSVWEITRPRSYISINRETFILDSQHRPFICSMRYEKEDWQNMKNWFWINMRYTHNLNKSLTRVSRIAHKRYHLQNRPLESEYPPTPRINLLLTLQIIKPFYCRLILVPPPPSNGTGKLYPRKRGKKERTSRN